MGYIYMSEDLVHISNTGNENAKKNSQIFTAALEIVKGKLSVVTIRPSTIHLIIKYVIEELEDTPLEGTEKKEIGLQLMRELIIDLTEGTDEEQLLKLLDDGTISNLIDLIIDATKGKLNVNALANVGIGCSKTCLPYCLPNSK